MQRPAEGRVSWLAAPRDPPAAPPPPGGSGASRPLRAQRPSIKIVVLTVSESEDYLLDAIRFGAHGYLLKDLRPEQLYELLRAVMRNETPLSPAIAGRLLQEVRRLSAGSAGTASAPNAGAR